MGKHGSSKVRTPERKASSPPPPKPATKPAAKPAPAVTRPEVPTQKTPDAVHIAASRVLAAATQLLTHLEHAPGCPSGGGGPCTCGHADFVAALEQLKTSASAVLTPS